RCAEALTQPLNARLGVEGAPCGGQLLLRDTPCEERRGLGPGAQHLELEPHRLAEVARQCLRELLLLRGGAHRLLARIVRQAHDWALAADEHTVARELARRPGELERVHDRGPRVAARRAGALPPPGGARGAARAARSRCAR